MSNRAAVLGGVAAVVLLGLLIGQALTASNTVPPTGAARRRQVIDPNDLRPSQCRMDVTSKITGSGTLTGTTGNDLIVGGSSADSLSGEAGDDCLHGGEGNDSLNGGDGTDVCIGGLGKDTFKNCETEHPD